MPGSRQQAFSARLAGLSVVLALHGALFYSLWHARTPPPPAETATLFVDLLTEPVRPEPPRPEPPRPKPKPVKHDKPVQPSPQLVAQTPVVLPSDPVAPPPQIGRAHV